jgi:hypothetical protein
MEHHSQPKRIWVNYREAVRRNFRRVDLDRFAVRAEPTGLHILLDSCRGLRGRTETWSIPWTEIQALVAFKSDNLTYDTIWVTVHTCDVKDEVRATASFPDTAEGWLPTLEALPRHLPGCEPFGAWFTSVAFPAFAENGRLIFDRAAA